MAKINFTNKTIKIQMTDGLLIPERDEKDVFSAWKISFFGAIALLSFLLVLALIPDTRIAHYLPAWFSKPRPYWRIFMFLPDGIVTTFFITLSSIFFAVIIGFFTGLGRISRIGIINKIANVYVEIIRGIPLLVQLFYIYFALGKFVQVPPATSAIIAMAICYGAYIGEIFRAGISSVSKGQMEAALALGLSRSQAMMRIIVPQTIKIILPPLGNEFIALLKDSSLVSILAISDLLRRGREFTATTFLYFETYTIVALVYLILTLFLSRVVGIMEERMKNEKR